VGLSSSRSSSFPSWAYCSRACWCRVCSFSPIRCGEPEGPPNIQHLISTVSQEDGAIEQFRVLAALWNRPEPFTDTVGQVPFEARIVDVSPNLAFRAFVRKYADVTIEAKAHKGGTAAQVVRATYRLRLGPMSTEGQRATRLVWQRS
jgi:hypothetical protein